MQRDLGHDLEHWFDLDAIPFTTRFSRLFVRQGPDGLTVYRAAYERSLRDSIIADGVRVVDEAGVAAQIRGVTPSGIEFDGGARLIVTADDALLVGGLPDQWRVEARVTGVDGYAVDPVNPCYVLARDTRERHFDDEDDAVLHTTAKWFASCPEVAEQWRDVVRLSWWVLGVNTLILDAPDGLNRAVVPSKIGYVGLWQWDAYFMAIGLRHGDPQLALEQMRIALAHQGADGQLPDVVHEEGILASSDDLPPGDLETLRAMASPSLANTRVPLTKPPLTALAVAKLAEVLGESVIDEFLPATLRAQEWWYTASAPSGQPAYLHPYSSGLDDSPIFDDDAIVVSPDLTAYLALSDRLLAGWLTARGRANEAQVCLARADDAVARLTLTWDDERSFFPALGEDGDRISSETIVSLMPVLAEGLRRDLVDALIAAINDPVRFGTEHPLPTVSASDPDFSPERMWRGPVWVNTNWLVAQGLRLQGCADMAERIERATLAMVTASGPNEYFRPDTGTKPPRSTTAFGWSAALTVDLAVALS